MPNGVCFKTEFVGAVHRVTAWKKIQFESPDEQQVHSMIPKTERYTDTLKQVLTRQRQKSNTNAYGRKGHERKRLYTNACGKERKNRPQMPVAKKDQTTNAGGK